MTAFDQALGFLIGHEGGFGNESADAGNWTGGAVGKGTLRGTKYGISAAAYPYLDIASLTIDDAAAIYHRDYWMPVRGDDLPPPLALLVFDAAVNNGISRAVRWLQMALGVLVDGRPGPETMAAIARSDVQAVCVEFMALRVAFMGALPTWRTFGLGWARRLCQLPYQAMQMGASAPQQ